MGGRPRVVEGGSYGPAIILLGPDQFLHPVGTVEFLGMVVETYSRSALEVCGVDCCYSVAVPIVLGIIIAIGWSC